MAKQIEVQHLNSQLTTVLRNLESGEEYIVIQNKKAVAKIVGLSSEEKAELNSDESGEKWTADDFNIKLSDE